MNYPTPIVTLKLENIKHTIVQHLSNLELERDQQFNEAVKRAVENFDFEGEVVKCVNEVVSKSIERYFKWGDGSEMVKSAVDDGLNNLFNQERKS